ncbi:tyrosine-type recombinase/integrase [Thalassobacillus sp. C254]|uniref:tyrosine-type recombinase/integrase n=1 Tax=Thalassobacillus sp. C254 TaxID=1225341 RepID=UPI0035B53EFA
MLSKHRSLQKQAKLKFGSAYQDHGLVISTADGKPIRPDNLRRHFLRLIELADVPRIRFHDLRHTHATLLLQMGEHPKIVSERLGHSKVSVTLDVYSHVIPDMQKRTADAFEKSMLESRTRKEI